MPPILVERWGCWSALHPLIMNLFVLFSLTFLLLLFFDNNAFVDAALSRRFRSRHRNQ
jgi:hypothetical protein